MGAVFVIVAVTACDKGGDRPAFNGFGMASTGSQAAPAAAGSQAAAPAAVAPAAAGSQAATPAAAAANPVAAPAGGDQVAPAAGSAAAGAPASSHAEKTFKVGDWVDGMWTNGRWYPGRIGAVNADGTFRVNYSDGDVSRSLPIAKVRHALNGGFGFQSTRGTSCGGGLMRCGGRCVDIHNDNHNCNACGRMCPEACMGGSCVSNHYKYGN
jgi:hypothetical protein